MAKMWPSATKAIIPGATCDKMIPTLMQLAKLNSDNIHLRLNFFLRGMINVALKDNFSTSQPTHDNLTYFTVRVITRYLYITIGMINSKLCRCYRKRLHHESEYHISTVKGHHINKLYVKSHLVPILPESIFKIFHT